MRSVLPFIFLLLFLPSCKKAIEKQKENIILAAMTSGEWRVASFIDDASDLTTDFNNYSFKYHDNRTVDAIKSGSVIKSGTWNENIDQMDISAQFQGASNPLALINGSWHIEETDWTYVIATQGNKSMRLEKL